MVIRSAEPTEEELEEFTRMQANDEVDVRGEMMGALIRGQVKRERASLLRACFLPPSYTPLPS